MLINERYKLEKQIGEGGENIIYLAVDTQTEKQVILKRGKSTLHGKRREQWIDEANFLKQIHFSTIWK